MLDLEDIKNFVAFRYQIKKLSKLKKRALDILSHMTSDKQGKHGAITIRDFEVFLQKNPTFVKFTHRIQMHLRRCIYGISFWVLKSRKIKHAQATGLDAVGLVSRANLESELFTVSKLKDPVVDARGRPIREGKKNKDTPDPHDDEEEKAPQSLHHSIVRLPFISFGGKPIASPPKPLKSKKNLSSKSPGKQKSPTKKQLHFQIDLNDDIDRKKDLLCWEERLELSK